MGFWKLGASAAAGLAAGIGGAAYSSKQQKKINTSNQDFAKYMRDTKVQSMVADANKAGIDPLAVLGGGGASPSPITESQSNDYMAQMGQNVMRAAINRAGTDTDYENQVKQLTLDNMRLKNQGLQNQITASKLRMAQNAGELVNPQPLNKIVEDPKNMGTDPSYINSAAYAKNTQGGYDIVPTEDIKNRIEDNIFQEAKWNFKNFHFFKKPDQTPNVPLEKGKKWVWDRYLQEWKQMNREEYLNASKESPLWRYTY